jgi:hypothetical protein
VPVFIEADGTSLLAGSAMKMVPLEIFVSALDAQGTVVDSFDQGLQLNIEKMDVMLLDTGVKFFGHLELPPGDVSLRVLVRNVETGAFGKRSLALHVPAWADAAPVLLQPFFPERTGRWAMVREQPRGELRDAAYPFVLGAKPYVPAVQPAVQPGQSIPVTLIGYHLGGGDLQARAQVQTADGRDVAGGTLQLGGRENGGGEAGVVEAKDLGGAGGGERPEVLRAMFQAPRELPPGPYRLVITVSGAGGSESSTSPFIVAAAAPSGR